jgi:hypothetical protein
MVTCSVKRPTPPRRLQRLANELVSPWTGLTHRPSWCHRCQVGSAVVLAGRAISVPFPARRLRFVTVNHGHARPFDLGALTTGARQHDW